MNKVFLVTYSDYDEYYIAAIFSTYEAAQKYILEADLNERGYDIEEWNVDEMIGAKKVQGWESRINIKTGKYKEWGQLYGEHLIKNKQIGSVVYSSEPVVAYVTSYISQEHATQLALEARQKYLTAKTENYEVFEDE